MLYEEFLKGTGAVETKSTWDEYQRVERIYMESNLMTKEDAYRMAQVVTIKEHEKMMARERKTEMAWVLENIIPAAAFVRGMSEKKGCFEKTFAYTSPCGNRFELRLVREINCGSVMQYEFWVNSKQIDTHSTGYGLLPSAEFSSYRANWYGKSREELEDLFGYIA